MQRAEEPLVAFDMGKKSVRDMIILSNDTIALCRRPSIVFTAAGEVELWNAITGHMRGILCRDSYNIHDLGHNHIVSRSDAFVDVYNWITGTRVLSIDASVEKIVPLS